jgi:DNA-binding response OmpR family regulator
MSLAQEQSKRPLRVLIVEDNADTAKLLAMLLRMHGFEAQTASDGPAALRSAEDRWPDAVLLDIGLPGMNGYQVAELIQGRSANRCKPVLIAMSGHGECEERYRGLAASIDRHFIKPMDPLVLIESLQQCVTGRE